MSNVGTLFQFFDELPTDEYAALKADIAKRGVLVPIEYDESGNILDGHHRKRVVDELGLKDYPTVVRRFSSDEEKEEHVVTLNVRRRHLDGAQKRKWAEWFLRRHPEWSDSRVASEVGLSHPTVAKVRADLESVGAVEKFTTRVGKDGLRQSTEKAKPTPAPTIFGSSRQTERAQSALMSLGDDAPAGLIDVKKAERAVRDKATEEARAAADASPVILGDVRIEHCSLSELDIEPESADLVFTDPPYPAEYVPLWSDLGQLAEKALKPGGLLVAYSGQLYLPEAMSRLAQHLDYWWMYSITHVGAFFQLRARHTQVGWKPLLVYRKPGGDLPPWVNDIVTDGVREKSGHEWQQSEAEAGYWIERLTDRGGLVVDPFLGSGTTAAVARKLGRRFIGCDVDPLAVARTKERVA